LATLASSLSTGTDATYRTCAPEPADGVMTARRHHTVSVGPLPGKVSPKGTTHEKSAPP